MKRAFCYVCGKNLRAEVPDEAEEITCCEYDCNEKLNRLRDKKRTRK